MRSNGMLSTYSALHRNFNAIQRDQIFEILNAQLIFAFGTSAHPKRKNRVVNNETDHDLSHSELFITFCHRNVRLSGSFVNMHASKCVYVFRILYYFDLNVYQPSHLRCINCKFFYVPYHFILHYLRVMTEFMYYRILCNYACTWKYISLLDTVFLCFFFYIKITFSKLTQIVTFLLLY